MRTCPKCGAESKQASAFCGLCFTLFERFSYAGTTIIDPAQEHQAMIRTMAVSGP